MAQPQKEDFIKGRRFDRLAYEKALTAWQSKQELARKTPTLDRITGDPGPKSAPKLDRGGEEPFIEKRVRVGRGSLKTIQVPNPLYISPAQRENLKIAQDENRWLTHVQSNREIKQIVGGDFTQVALNNNQSPGSAAITGSNESEVQKQPSQQPITAPQDELKVNFNPKDLPPGMRLKDFQRQQRANQVFETNKGYFVQTNRGPTKFIKKLQIGQS